jgi:hypothetical protein
LPRLAGRPVAIDGETLRRMAINLLECETTKPKEPIRGKRIFAALDPSYLESIIGLRLM